MLENFENKLALLQPVDINIANSKSESVANHPHENFVRNDSRRSVVYAELFRSPPKAADVPPQVNHSNNRLSMQQVRMRCSLHSSCIQVKDDEEWFTSASFYYRQKVIYIFKVAYCVIQEYRFVLKPQ